MRSGTERHTVQYGIHNLCNASYAAGFEQHKARSSFARVQEALHAQEGMSS